jgi:holo-[acyl-carrier protein] synthase
MTIIGIGLDVVKIDRVRAMVERWHDRFLTRLYTEDERQLSAKRASPYAFLAGRFAAKEAILKALGTGWSGGVRWLDIQVLNDPAGRPVATVQGRAEALIREAGITHILISLAHDGDYAMAEAVLTTDRS